MPTNGDCTCDGIDLPSLLEGLSDPAAVIDPGRRIIAANQTYRDRFNGGEKVCGQFCFAVSHNLRVPCDQRGERCPMAIAEQHGGWGQALHAHQTSNGEQYEIVTAQTLNGHGDSPMGFLETHRPVAVASAQPDHDRLVGRSPAFRQMLDLVTRVASTQIPVLLLGESGTGKELVAQSLHQMSPSAEGPFVPVDCSGLTESLFESELFGHEKGAFTGAYGSKRGLVQVAHGGTLFLDEVGDIPLSLQVKLLRLLETGTFRRVGSVEQRRSDFRLVCATHRDLEQMVSEGSFRSDLYYRMSAFPIRLPPLRERIEDIQLLIEALLDRWGSEHISRIHPKTVAVLRGYSFPGNVRELQNILQRACLLCEGQTLMPRHLPSRCRKSDASAPILRGELLPLEEVERRYLERAAASFEGDRSDLAHRLGLSERTLYRKLHSLREARRSSSPDSTSHAE